MPLAWGWSHAFSLALFIVHLLVVARAITRPAVPYTHLDVYKGQQHVGAT